MAHDEVQFGNRVIRFKLQSWNCFSFDNIHSIALAIGDWNFGSALQSLTNMSLQLWRFSEA